MGRGIFARQGQRGERNSCLPAGARQDGEIHRKVDGLTRPVFLDLWQALSGKMVQPAGRTESRSTRVLSMSRVSTGLSGQAIRRRSISTAAWQA